MSSLILFHLPQMKTQPSHGNSDVNTHTHTDAFSQSHTLSNFPSFTHLHVLAFCANCCALFLSSSLSKSSLSPLLYVFSNNSNILPLSSHPFILTVWFSFYHFITLHSHWTKPQYTLCPCHLALTPTCCAFTSRGRVS